MTTVGFASHRVRAGTGERAPYSVLDPCISRQLIFAYTPTSPARPWVQGLAKGACARFAAAAWCPATRYGIAESSVMSRECMGYTRLGGSAAAALEPQRIHLKGTQLY
jgi:hypothetical protein